MANEKHIPQGFHEAKQIKMMKIKSIEKSYRLKAESKQVDQQKLKSKYREEQAQTNHMVENI